MDEERFARVAELMDQMAGHGGVAAAFALQAEFAGPLRGAVRRIAARRGVELSPAELDELLADVALVLFDLAGSWRPDGGALPWVWAEHRIANAVDRHLGLFTDELDDERQAVVDQQPAHMGGSSSEPASREVLASLAERHPLAAGLADALDEVATARDCELWLEMRVQESIGDRSPAASVGPTLGLSAEAARQQRRRVDQRLRRLAHTNRRFAALSALVPVA